MQQHCKLRALLKTTSNENLCINIIDNTSLLIKQPKLTSTIGFKSTAKKTNKNNGNNTNKSKNTNATNQKEIDQFRNYPTDVSKHQIA